MYFMHMIERLRMTNMCQNIMEVEEMVSYHKFSSRRITMYNFCDYKVSIKRIPFEEYIQWDYKNEVNHKNYERKGYNSGIKLELYPKLYLKI